MARGESETPAVLLPAGPDLTLYIEDAGIFVINGLKLPGMLRLISICRMAISKDFLESVRPKPELSGHDADFPDELGECLLSCLGGANFRMLTTRSTILLPITTGFTSSLTFECPRLTAGTELPLERPFEARPLEGEHDWRLCFPLLTRSLEAARIEGAAGLPLVAERGLSGRLVLRFGGASKEKPGISDGFHGLDLTVGDAPREGTGFLDGADPDLLLSEEEDLFRVAEAPGTLDGVDGRRVGVDDLDVGRDRGTVGRDAGTADRDGGTVGRDVGVEDLAVDLDGVEDLDGLDDRAEGLALVLDGVDDLERTADLEDTAEVVDPADINELEGLGDKE